VNQQQTAAVIKNESSQIHLNSHQKDYSRIQSTKKVYDVILIELRPLKNQHVSGLLPRNLFIFIRYVSACFQFYSIFGSKFSLLSVVKVIAKGMTFQDAASKMRRALTEFRKITIS
jgi:hypothetical protein